MRNVQLDKHCSIVEIKIKIINKYYIQLKYSPNVISIRLKTS